ncbi:hypothetical protein SUGI_0242530 [Cryptomeria japonica]|nr:hypothetical protein SUGI_0242530 [Cryptomeria japonica]
MESFPTSASGIAISYSQISHEAPTSEIARWSHSHPNVSQRERDIRDHGHPSVGSTVHHNISRAAGYYPDWIAKTKL